MNRLERGGEVQLWSGWAIELPPACVERNMDSSWSAWGADWTLDISIVDTSGDSEGRPVTALQLRGPIGTLSEIEGKGWTGLCSIDDDLQEGRRVHRLSAKLCVTNSVLFCTVSFFEENQKDFARSLLTSVRHA